MTSPRVSVVMPTFEQAAFLPRALGSLVRQSVQHWELVVVDDGSTDATAAVVRAVPDTRVRYLRLPGNGGLGAAANAGLAVSTAPLVAYLPSDDVWHADHLAALLEVLTDERVVLAWSGMRHHGAAATLGCAPGFPLQLVQVAHRRTPDRWVERDRLESDDLERLFWSALRRRGATAGTGRVTCEWVDHPGQRHKAIRESYDGGLNVFRTRYQVTTPLRFSSSDSSEVDEYALYARFRDAAPPAPAPDGLRILLVGELSFNPERVLAFVERGHQLFGLWTAQGLGDAAVGPLPFPGVEDLPRDGWLEAARAIRPDVVYALLNWRAVPLAHAVLSGLRDAGLAVPFVWHLKESPQRCIHRGDWPRLVDLHSRSDAQVYSTPEELAWFEAALPGRLRPELSLVLDGDLPKREWFTADRSPLLSADDGEIHTAVLGRPAGLDASVVSALAAAGVHLHLYGLVDGPGPKGAWRSWLDDARRLAPAYVHVHPHVDQRSWVRELSRYDAGWLHRFRADNGGDLARATWDDLNYPARIPAFLAAGVPLLQQRSPGSVVAAERLIDRTAAGVGYADVEDLCAQLADSAAMGRRRSAAWAVREEFTFDRHVDRLLDLFRGLTGRPPRQPYGQPSGQPASAGLNAAGAPATGP